MSCRGDGPLLYCMKFLSVLEKKYNIIFSKDISDYYTLPIENIFNDLKKIKKDVYAGNERIVLYDTSNGIKEYYDLINTQLQELDIPDFFVLVVTNNKYAKLITCNSESGLYDLPITKVINNKTGIDFSKMCVNPWINIEIANNGKLSVCCEYRGSSSYILSSSIEEFYNSDEVNTIRQQFINKQFPNGCTNCEQIEKVGGKSKRLRDMYVYREDKFKIDWQKPKIDDLVSLDIKLGNLCNLACRICNVNNSSLWAKEENKTVKIYTPNWFNNLTGLNISSLKYLQFTGGEPLLEKTHLSLLSYLINTNVAKNVSIHYNSNGTIFPEYLLDIWKQFKSIEISLSIDNLYEKFDYERYGLIKWKTVADVIEKFNKTDNIILNVYCTVTIFNIADLENIYQYFARKNMPVVFNILENPRIYNIQHLPKSAKTFISNKLLNTTDITFKNLIEPIVNAMNSNSYNFLYENFITVTNKLDKRRNQSFRLIYPELAKLIDYVDFCK